MNPEADARREFPDFPWLAAGDVDGVARYLAQQGWLEPGEDVISAERAGDGNMNLTLRVRTPVRSFILKQARPWVEKYPEIAAPWDRSHFEQRFYERVAKIPELVGKTPALLACDAEAHVLVFEDVAPARDRSDLYAKGVLDATEIREIADFIAVLHGATWGPADRAMQNLEMRALNHTHVFELPLAPDNGVDLEAHEPGLTAAARALAEDDEAKRVFAETAKRYLGDGPCLLHGDYFPGSWLHGDEGLRIIDPEFCFYGPPEVDLGCAVAHFALANQPLDSARRLLADYERARLARPGAQMRAFEPEWLARFAAAEVMRRLIGVAQLPIAASTGWRSQLLARTRSALLAKDWTALWA